MEELFKSSVSVPETTLVRALPDGESVLLSMANERYFSLDRTGTEMWNALTTAASVEDALQRLLPKYDVAENRLRADLEDLVDRLVAQGLIDINTA